MKAIRIVQHQVKTCRSPLGLGSWVLSYAGIPLCGLLPGSMIVPAITIVKATAYGMYFMAYRKTS